MVLLEVPFIQVSKPQTFKRYASLYCQQLQKRDQNGAVHHFSITNQLTAVTLPATAPLPLNDPAAPPMVTTASLGTTTTIPSNDLAKIHQPQM